MFVLNLVGMALVDNEIFHSSSDFVLGATDANHNSLSDDYLWSSRKEIVITGVYLFEVLAMAFNNPMSDPN